VTEKTASYKHTENRFYFKDLTFDLGNRWDILRPQPFQLNTS